MEKNEPIESNRKRIVKNALPTLKPCCSEADNVYEIGVDESGRGPLFGRVYAAAVILPKGDSAFDFSKIKDSKK